MPARREGRTLCADAMPSEPLARGLCKGANIPREEFSELGDCTLAAWRMCPSPEAGLDQLECGYQRAQVDMVIVAASILRRGHPSASWIAWVQAQRQIQVKSGHRVGAGSSEVRLQMLRCAPAHSGW